MEKLEKATGGAALSTSGDNELGGDSNNATSGAQLKSAEQKQYEKLLKEKKNAMLALEEKENQLNELIKYKQEKEEAELLKTKQYETLISTYKDKLSKAEIDLKAEKELNSRSRINSAFLSELKKLGFVENESNKEAALKLASFKSVVVDPTINSVVGAEEEAKEFLEKFSHLGFFEKKTGGISNTAPKYNLNLGDKPDITKMNKKEKMEYLASLSKR